MAGVLLWEQSTDSQKLMCKHNTHRQDDGLEIFFLREARIRKPDIKI